MEILKNIKLGKNVSRSSLKYLSGQINKKYFITFENRTNNIFAKCKIYDNFLQFLNSKY